MEKIINSIQNNFYKVLAELERRNELVLGNVPAERYPEFWSCFELLTALNADPYDAEARMALANSVKRSYLMADDDLEAALLNIFYVPY